MMRLSGHVLLLVGILGLSGTGMRAAQAECLAAPSMSVAGLTRTACESAGVLIVERYSDKEADSPYATDFDRRRLAVAYGEDASALRAAVGAKVDAGYTLMQTTLLKPPMSDQVSQRSPEKEAKYRDWTVAAEKIDYGAQGDAKGFTLDCATATRLKGKVTVVVAECFPLEERGRFYRALDSVR